MAAPSPDKPAFPGAAAPAAGSPTRDGSKRREGPRSRAAEMEEADIWWGSYAGRTALPGLLLCLLLTVVLLAIDWYLDSRNTRSDLISSAVLGLAGALWIFAGIWWVYRMIVIIYRLIDCRLL